VTTIYTWGSDESALTWRVIDARTGLPPPFAIWCVDPAQDLVGVCPCYRVGIVPGCSGGFIQQWVRCPKVVIDQERHCVLLWVVPPAEKAARPRKAARKVEGCTSEIELA